MVPPGPATACGCFRDEAGEGRAISFFRSRFVARLWSGWGVELSTRSGLSMFAGSPGSLGAGTTGGGIAADGRGEGGVKDSALLGLAPPIRGGLK